MIEENTCIQIIREVNKKLITALVYLLLLPLHRNTFILAGSLLTLSSFYMNLFFVKVQGVNKSI